MLLDVIIEGQPAWTELFGAFIVGLMGALIGATAVFGVEIWRQVLEFRTGIRILNYELLSGRTTLKAGLKDPTRLTRLPLNDDGWSTYKSYLAILLPERLWFAIAVDYDILVTLKGMIAEFDSNSKELVDTFSGRIEKSEKSMEICQDLIHSLNGKSRLSLFWTSIQGKTLVLDAASNERLKSTQSGTSNSPEL